MFAKLAVLIIGIGMIGGGLLATRQQRIQAAHELADAQRRVTEHDRTLWQLRIEIAQRVTPDQVALKLRELGPMSPIGPFRYQELVQHEAQRAQELADLPPHSHPPTPKPRSVPTLPAAPSVIASSQR